MFYNFFTLLSKYYLYYKKAFLARFITKRLQNHFIYISKNTARKIWIPIIV
ncbi:hypothetical protein PB1A_0571 [Leuconostoc inhae]|uniref:Uncharacterized protein n=2 Tax=Leuconostoc TaxID=1243 RepID=A0AAN2UF36_9LACO|nr:hypothetical protein LEGAS_1650 [Leuconostoc gasicomitatum LMG 18811]CUW06160.1 hypothetical protein KSL4_1805 [Leuconostoc inhae]CUW07924.1 hypothetical protein C122C_0530 [Leuconostoc gasicomitatum]CUW07250.1 hypothetical protein PL111_0943 [Leuconostoc inhae]CUW13582.1 hypothetical protein PB1A_0571 [Leuconostoc inhae]